MGEEEQEGGKVDHRVARTPYYRRAELVELFGRFIRYFEWLWYATHAVVKICLLHPP